MKCAEIVQKSLLEKKIFNNNNSTSASLYIKLAMVQNGGQSNKFPLSYNFFRCLLQAKKHSFFTR